MPFMPLRNFVLVITVWLAFDQLAIAQTQSAQQCFAEKDAACLEAMFADIVSNPSAEKAEAIYLLGLLKLEEKDYIAAKDQFGMGMAFGGDKPELIEQLTALYESGKVVFDPADCLMIENEACLESIVDSDDTLASRNAQYLLAGLISKSDPKRAHTLYESAAEAGHKTAICYLQKIYAQGYDGQKPDFHKSVTYGLECPFSPPFKRFDRKHFAKYEKKKGHKAFALSESGFSNFAVEISSPGWAATLAKLYCDNRLKRKAEGMECQVINVDGKFVEQTNMKPLPEQVNSVEDLVKNKAKKAFKKYQKVESSKVFVQSASGAWSWRSSSDKSLDQLKNEALKSCENQWESRLGGFACKVVNLNGEWVN